MEAMESKTEEQILIDNNAYVFLYFLIHRYVRIITQ